MKKDIHPQYFETTVHCIGCGSTFVTGSTVAEIRVHSCSVCHPHYTGTQKFLDAEGRVDRFKKKYSKFTPAAK